MPAEDGSIPIGKLPQRLLADLLGRAGPLPPEVRVGPAIGEDAAVIDVPRGALVAASDPVTLTSGDVGGLASIRRIHLAWCADGFPPSSSAT